MVTAADGTAFTGSVTVAVTVDAGTQATGSVGAGACAHEGNGYHTYAPAQAETNGDLVAFTFTGTGAVPTTVQVYTVAGDSFTRLGAPAGASVSADVAAVKVDTAAILVDTGTTLDARIPAALVSGRMDTSVGAMAANVLTAAAINAAAFTKAKFHADTGLIPVQTGTAQAGAATTIQLAAAGASGVDDTYNGHLVYIISGTGAGQARFITDYVGATTTATVGTWQTNPDNTSVYAVLPSNALSSGSIADAVLDDALLDSVPADGALPTVRQAIYMISQFLFERSVSGTTLTIRKADGSSALMTFTLSDATSPVSITRTT